MRRVLVTLMFVVSIGLAIPTQVAVGEEVDHTLPVSTPEANGVDSGLLADALLAIRDNVPYVHSVLVERGGSVFLDAYFYPYDGSTPHDVASVTKSITATLIGIAIDQGKLSLDDPVLSFFPDREIANLDARKEQITVRHLLNMTSGLETDTSFGEPTLMAMLRSENFTQFALDLPMVAEPGTTFAYLSPGTHILSAILTEATGMTEFAFAQQYLFEPLGFGTVYWPEDAQGYTHGWGDAVIHPHDLVKLGKLWQDGGAWNSEQVVSQAWIEAATSPQADTGDSGTGYGFGFWVELDPAAGGEFGAVGRGGQFVTVLPAIDVIFVVTGGAGSFDDSEVSSLIAGALVNPDGALPANPEATTKLAATLDALQQSPEPVPFTIPPAANECSGTQYVMQGGNELGVEWIKLVFDDTAEAELSIKMVDAEEPSTGKVGLDGVFRITEGAWGMPEGARGSWVDDHTFVFEQDRFANNNRLIVTFEFEGDDVTVTAQNGFSVDGLTILGAKYVEGG